MTRLGAALVAIAFGGAIALAGCGGPSRPAQPAWADDATEAPGTMVATASAAQGDRILAEQRARAALARRLMVSVQASMQTDERVDTTAASGATGTTRSSTYVASFRQQASETSLVEDISGAKPTRSEDAGGQTWVQMTLDCRLWAGVLRQRIAALDAQLAANDRAFKQANPAPAIGPVIRLARQQLPLVDERERKLRLLVLALANDPVADRALPAPPFDLAAFKAQVTRVIDDLTVSIAPGPGLDSLLPMIGEALARQRLNVVDADGTLQLVLAVRMRERAGDSKRIVEGKLDATVREPGTARSLGALPITASGAGSDTRAAMETCRRALAEQLAAAIDAQCTAILNRL